MKGTGAKRNVCPGSCMSTGATFPVAPVESAPMADSRLRPRFATAHILRLAASATAHGLAVWLHHQAGRLIVPVLHRHPCKRSIMCKYDVIHKPEVHNVSQRRQKETEPRT